MSAANKIDVRGGFSNETEWSKVVYDISASDTGTVGNYDFIEAKEDIVVLDFYLDVQAACTSDGSALMNLGVDDGGTEFLNDKAVATMEANYVCGMDTAAPVKVASGSKIVFWIESAALTAGKVAFHFLIKKV